MLTAPYSPWKELSVGAKETWLKKIDYESHYFFQYMGEQLPFKSNYLVNGLLRSTKFKYFWSKNHTVEENVELVTSNTIKVDVPERWDTMLTKFLSSVSYINSVIDYDYLIKINTTTWINLDKLQLYLEAKKPLCAGVIEKNKTFPAGWASVFSRALLENMLNSILRFPLNESGYDDELVGQILERFEIYPDRMTYAKYPNSPIEELIQVPFIRIKSENGRITNDLRRFHEVDELLKNRK